MTVTRPALCRRATCRAPLVRPTTGRPPRFCSSTCRKAAWKAGRRRSVHHSSASVEWYTPPGLFAAWSETYGPFDLDPATDPRSPLWPLIGRHYTVRDDGLVTPEAADAWVKAHDNGRHDEHWRPSILMPRWASRTSLRVVSVTLQRADECTNTLNETRDDRIRCALNHCPVARRPLGCQLMPDVDDLEARREGFASRAAFLDVWNKLHPDYNGPVYRIEFARINR